MCAWPYEASDPTAHGSHRFRRQTGAALSPRREVDRDSGVVRNQPDSIFPKSDKIQPLMYNPDLFAEGDTWLLNCANGIDTVVHIAWYAEPGQYQFSLRNLDCLAGTVRLAKAAVHAGVRGFVGLKSRTAFRFRTNVGGL